MVKTIAGALLVVVMTSCAIAELDQPRPVAADTSAFEYAGLRDEFKAPC